MKSVLLLFRNSLAISSLFLYGLASQAYSQVNRNISQYNLTENVGLKGFDPVAVFPEGGGQARSGNPEFRFDFGGVIYYFATAANRDTFQSSPERYEPTYGGWCAYAMASGSKVDIQPTLFTISGNRAHYFVAARAKRNFEADIEGHEWRADENWLRISGESPRL